MAARRFVIIWFVLSLWRRFRKRETITVEKMGHHGNNMHLSHCHSTRINLIRIKFDPFHFQHRCTNWKPSTPKAIKRFHDARLKQREGGWKDEKNSLNWTIYAKSKHVTTLVDKFRPAIFCAFETVVKQYRRRAVADCKTTGKIMMRNKIFDFHFIPHSKFVFLLRRSN